MKVSQLIKKLEKIDDKNKDVVVVSPNMEFKVAEVVEEIETIYVDMMGMVIENPQQCVRIR